MPQDPLAAIREGGRRGRRDSRLLRPDDGRGSSRTWPSQRPDAMRQRRAIRGMRPSRADLLRLGRWFVLEIAQAPLFPRVWRPL